MSSPDRQPFHPEEALNSDQQAAIRTVMRLMFEDDVAQKVGVFARDVDCSPCNDKQPAVGAAKYGENIFCHPRAVDYELWRAALRISHLSYITRRRVLARSSNR